MKKFYQIKWQNIYFKSFCEMSSEKLAGVEFYNKFYRIFFEKYLNYDDIEISWRQDKDKVADWLGTMAVDGSRVLSVGCGLGYIEQRLWLKNCNRIDLHVQDYSCVALKWLKLVLPFDCIHKDLIKTEIGKFDLIYLSAVDYAISDDNLIELILSLREILSPNGRLVLISASFIEEESITIRVISVFKEIIKWGLDKIGLQSRGQFWGWLRSSADYHNVMRQANLLNIVDGFIEAPSQRIYWIQGC